jgi:hypothetical protein
LELPRLGGILAALAATLLLIAPGSAGARGVAVTRSVTTSVSSSSDQPVLVTNLNKPPAGFTLTAAQVLRIAARDPRSKAELRRHREAVPYEYTKGLGQWQVSWFSSGRKQKELLQVYVDDTSGKVTQVWTGFQVAWTMARGYPGAFGRRVNALYVWLPLCALLIAPFLPWRRPRILGGRSGPGTPRWSLLHLDLFVLLAFSVSLAFFNHAEIGLSVPLVYPFLIYLLVRVVLLAFGRGRPRQPLRPAVPVSWLAIGVIFLVGFRIGLNVVDANVIDVGYAGVIGANKLEHGQKLYGHWPPDNAYGDTYGPVNYYAYAPAVGIFGWSGSWDDLPAAHAAAILFDLLTLFGLYWLGRRVRGPALGVILAYAWAAYPFTLFTLSSNSNDTLVSALVVGALLVLSSAPARGAMAALAGLTKFVPFALTPLLLRGTGPWPRKRSLLVAVLAFAVTTVVAMLPVLLDHNLQRFWHDTVVYQTNRPSPFSIWGLWGGLKPEQRIVQGLTVLLALGAAFVPRGERGVVEVAALATAILLAVELSLTHWFYLYIVWFFPPLIVALFGAHPEPLIEPEPVGEAERLVPAAA